MKTVNKQSLVLLAAIAALSGTTAHAARNLPVTETFSSFNATSSANTTTQLPGFKVESDPVANSTTWRGLGASQTGAGFWSLGTGNTSSADTERAFGILETSSFGDARLLLEVKKPSAGTAITALRVKYTVEQWRDGERANSIKLKYNPGTGVAGVIPGGYSEQPEFKVTVGPKQTNSGALDGNTSGNYTSVDTIVPLEVPLAYNVSGNTTGWLRWQFATASGSGNRDKLAIDDVEVTDASAAGTNQTWSGNFSSTWDDSTANWSGNTTWINDGNSNAVFTGPVSLTLGDNIVATGLTFSSGNSTIASSGSETLTPRGLITVDDGTSANTTVTINSPIVGDTGVYKTGADILALGSGSNTYTGTTAVLEGTLTGQIPAASALFIGAAGEYVTGNTTRTVNGVSGASGGAVDVTGGTLVLDVTSTASYKGNITGSGDVVKEGAGTQKFRDSLKDYTGNTTVNEGILEVTENAELSTGSITVDGGDSELLLSNDQPLVSHDLGGGTITLTNNGSLASETDDTVVVNNDIVIGTGGGRIYARGTDTTAQLTLNGVITGSTTLTRQGQGELVLAGVSDTFTGNVNLNNGRTNIAADAVLGVGGTPGITVTLQGSNSDEPASLYGLGEIGGSVVYAGNSSVTLVDVAEFAAAGGPLIITGNLTLGNTTIDASNVDTGETYPLFQVGGTPSYDDVTIVGGGGNATLTFSGGILSLDNQP